ncbi:MAG: hypothetical protein ACXAC6_09260 [Candidatus Hodarchaeales archaeon]|jgi:hypothetical protein
MIKNGFKTLSAIILVFLVISTINPVSAAIVWEETFENLDDWQLFGYTLVDGIYTTSIDTPLSLVDGALTGKYYPGWGQNLWANHNSSVAYGTWKFDWHIPSGQDTYTAVIFIYNEINHYNDFEGVNQTDYVRDLTGFQLALINFGTPQIFLNAFWGDMDPSTEELRNKSFSSNLDGLHHITITRTPQGFFQVFDNETLLFTYSDNTITTSEIFSFLGGIGSPRIDNISVSNSVESTTTTTTTQTSSFSNVLLVLPVLATLTVIFQKRRKD